MGTKWVYLAQHVTKQDIHSLIRNTMQWRHQLGKLSPIKVKASYVDRLQRDGEANLAGEEIVRLTFQEIESCSGLVADLSKPDTLYVGVLVEIGYALALGLPVVIYAPGGVNTKITERKMLSTCTIVHTKPEAAQAIGRLMTSR